MILNTEKKILITGLVLILAGVGFFIFNETKPRPGTDIADLGRGHVPIGTKIDYNSNPPTSGPHYEIWVKPGVYDRPQEDRNLVHSLEHGYIVISYNCDLGNTNEGSKKDNKTATEDSTQSAKLTDKYDAEDCKKLISDLTAIYEQKGKNRIVIVPRPDLDIKLALTAWGKLDKLDNFDKKRIENFIDSNRNKGPEKTME